MNMSHTSSVPSSNLIDAKLEEQRMCELRKCPNCGHKLDSKPDWVGLPAGVKFDPSDQELMEHLEAKVKAEGSKPHPLIDEFIPTIEGEDGICYTHPQKLPGVTKDGVSKHFFHRPSKAYTTGTRKRRKIQTECELQRGETRWHKTGKTRPVVVNGKQKGCKKILVLYTNFGKHRKPEKTNWVMHQYHLGEVEEEKEGELVVSKIFYQTQPRQCNWHSMEQQARECGTNVTCSSSKEVAMEMDHHLKPADSFSFDEVNIREVNEGTRAAFHMINPTNPISAIVAPLQLHQATINLDNAYHVSTILLHSNDKLQQQHQEKLERGSTSGLEELIMGCTSSIKGETSIPQAHTQETEWQYNPYNWLPETLDHHQHAK